MKKLENNFYKSVKDLPLSNFYEILNSNNFNHLRKNIDYSTVDEFPVDDDDYIILSSQWMKIYEEYAEALGGTSNSKDYMILGEISELEVEMQIVATLCQAHHNRPLKLFEIEIRRWGYDPDDMDKNAKKLKGIKFRISIIKSKNPDIFSVTDKEKEESIEYDLYKDVVLLEDSIGSGKTIDVNTTVVARWIHYIKHSENKNKRIKSIRNG